MPHADNSTSATAKSFPTNLTKLCERAAKAGVLINSGTLYNTKHSRNFTRLGFSALNIEEQQRAVQVLSDALH